MENKNLETEIEELLDIMEKGEVNGAQILSCSAMLAEYNGSRDKFNKYYQRLIKVRVKA